MDLFDREWHKFLTLHSLNNAPVLAPIKQLAGGKFARGHQFVKTWPKRYQDLGRAAARGFQACDVAARREAAAGGRPVNPIHNPIPDPPRHGRQAHGCERSGSLAPEGGRGASGAPGRGPPGRGAPGGGRAPSGGGRAPHLNSAPPMPMGQVWL